jgi:hypothetical protein
MPANDDETPWYRSLLVGLGAMLAVALVVGVLVGVVAVGAVKLAGIGGEERIAAEETPTLLLPERSPREDTGEDTDGPTLEDLTGIGPSPGAGKDATGDEGDDRGREKQRKRPRRQRSVISLSASPLEVSSMQRIDLTGTYPGGEGATLQVQRFEGGWSSFSGVTARVSGETFSTYVMTGRTGTNRFRVVDPSSGKASNPVRVRVG